MKKIFSILSICCSLAVFPVLGQQKALIANQWNVLAFWARIDSDFYKCQTYTYVLAYDTVINSTHYQAMLRHQACDSLPSLEQMEYVGAIRQTEHQVYFYNEQSEKLLYDFDVSVGDQRLIYAGINHVLENEDEAFTNVVTDIQFLEDGRRVICVDILIMEEVYDHEVWIEGIGSVSGVLYTGSTLVGGDMYHLLCAHNDSDLLYSTQSATFQPLGCCYNKEPQTSVPLLYDCSNAHKAVRNGRFVIVQNDNTYNVFGQKL